LSAAALGDSRGSRRFESAASDFQWCIRAPIPYLLPDATPGPGAYAIAAAPPARGHFIQERKDPPRESLSSGIGLADLRVFPRALPLTIGTRQAAARAPPSDAPPAALAHAPPLAVPPITIGVRRGDARPAAVPGPGAYSPEVRARPRSVVAMRRAPARAELWAQPAVAPPPGAYDTAPPLLPPKRWAAKLKGARPPIPVARLRRTRSGGRRSTQAAGGAG
jgi:hypothetical protein